LEKLFRMGSTINYDDEEDDEEYDEGDYENEEYY
jgi:hypothetical protein